MEGTYTRDWETMLAIDNHTVEKNTSRLTEFVSEVSDHFEAKQWCKTICERCQNIFFTKRLNLKTCAKCTPTLEFLQYSKRKHELKHTELRDQCQEIFGRKYTALSPMPIVPRHGNTLFSVAGVQAFNPHIFGAVDLVTNPSIILQPSIRLQGMEDTTEYPGCSTAFVNTVTLHAQASIEQHLQHIDYWLEYLAATGLNIKDLRASLRFQIQNWGTGNCINCNVDMAYGGLDIFNASFFQQMPTKTTVPVDISDMGITIERTLWAINKTPSYFDVIGPYELSLDGRHIILDAVRTMVLMYASAVLPNAKDGPERMRAQKARAFAKKSAILGQNINIASAVDYFYDYWTSYMSLVVDRKTVQEIIQKEFARARNIHIAEALSRPVNTPKVDTTIDQYIAFLLDNGVERDKLARVLCQTTPSKKPKE